MGVGGIVMENCFKIIEDERLVSYARFIVNELRAGFVRVETDFGQNPIKTKIQAIGDFTELGEFLDLPLTCYSAGMVMRLAFAVVTASEPEILLIDEVFSTGDLAFQNKAEARMTEFIHKARVVIMVGHNLGFLEKFCPRILWLQHGKLIADGPAKQVIAQYRDNVAGSQRAIVGAAA